MGNQLEGKVAIVTGAGRGLGRCEAIELAKHGARVVVNDLGVGADGSGSSQGPAQEVVEEIKGFGGEAIAAYGDATNWSDCEKTLKTAIDTFGDLNILVNNAGFCRDKMIFSMSEEEFDSVINVHLKGHFVNMRFATAYWRQQSKAKGEPIYGRLISTSSEAFLFGSIGQPNYAAAKGGITALTMCAAQAMARYGVTANVICPRARTAMTLATEMTAAMFAKPEEGFDTFAPENVSPLVAYLASPQAERISGHVFIIWGKEVQMVNGPTLGEKFETEDVLTVENLGEKMGPHFEKLEPIKDGYVLA
jgi:3-oxoacyl-[acyl-carrier protein] reductase